MPSLAALTQLALAFALAACRQQEAAATDDDPLLTARQPTPVQLGVEVLLSDSLHIVRDKRVGLITNHTGRDSRGTSTIDLLHGSPDVNLAALYSPEHGIRGAAEAGARIASSTDTATGLPIHSLYGETRVPTPAMLQNVDVLVYDIQDVGARVYTYVWTMTLAAEAAKRAGKRLIILDRPNPIRADVIEGGRIEQRYKSFTGLHDVALRYGLTPGELALYLVGTRQIDADISVVPMKGYRLSMWWDATGLQWVNPSPNIRDVEAAALYPGTVFFEATNLSEGRGTDAPFKVVGAPWLTDAAAIADSLNAKKLPGVRFGATWRNVARGAKYGGENIPMIRVSVTNRDSLRAVDVGAHMLREIYRRHRAEFQWRETGIERLSGSRALRLAVQNGGVEELLTRWRGEARAFSREIAGYRLYPQ